MQSAAEKRKLPHLADRSKVDFSGQGNSQPKDTLHRQPDRQHPGRGPRSPCCRRETAAERHQQCHLLSLAAKYVGTSVDELKRLRELEVENGKFKGMYAELALENAAINDVLNRKR
jgi:hypothetical protein